MQFQTVTSAPDGDGGLIDTWTTLDPAWRVAIQPANVHDLERRTAGTIVATATHIVTGRYRADVDIDDQMLFDGRTFRISGVKNVDERGLVMELFVVETVN